jgi:hypothetical protein
MDFPGALVASAPRPLAVPIVRPSPWPRGLSRQVQLNRFPDPRPHAHLRFPTDRSTSAIRVPSRSNLTAAQAVARARRLVSITKRPNALAMNFSAIATGSRKVSAGGAQVKKHFEGFSARRACAIA